MSGHSSFHATYVHFQREDGELLVGFADDATAPRRYLTLQRQTSPSPQDVKLGHDRAHLELDDQHQSGYGAVSRCVLSAGSMSLELDPAWTAKMGRDACLEVTFDLPPESLRNLRETLGAIFAGGTAFHDESDHTP